MVDEQRLVFPVGQFGGMVRGDGPGSGPDDVRFSIRRGDAVWTVESDPGMLWLDAHGQVDTLTTTAWTRDAVLGHRRSLSPVTEAKAYGQLLGLKLVAEVDPAEPEAVDFARGHRLVPRAHGLGNRSEDPSRFLAGFPPDQVAMFTWHQWRLWRQSHLEPSLWDGCRRLAADEQGAGRTLDARALLTDVLRGLHVMLAIQLAYLDVARGAGA